MGCWLGIDAGTSGLKALVLEESGEILAEGYAELDVQFPGPGCAEQRPEDWWAACKKAVSLALQGRNIGKEIQAVGFSGQMQRTVFLDGDNRPVRDCLIWMDQRAVQEVEEIAWKLRAAGLDGMAVTANQCLNTFWAPKILWMRNNEPEHYERIRKIIFPKDYLAFRMTGELAMEVSDASLSYLLDVPRRKWSDEMFRALDIPKELVPNRLLESCEVVGTLKKSVAGELGLLEGIPVIAGGGDQTANGVGTGIIEERVMGASIGTSAVVFGCSRKPFYDRKQRAIQSLCHSVPDLWSYLGLSLTAGASLKWVRDVFFAGKKQAWKSAGKNVYVEITRIAAQARPGCRGLMFLPWFNGDSAPNNDPYARACFFGMSLDHGMAELTRSVLEGVVYSLRETVEVCREDGREIGTIRVSGGGAKSSLWRQIQADILKASVVTMKITEGPAAGAAILAAVGSGYFKDVKEGCRALLKTDTVTEPIREHEKIYEEYFQIYRGMYGCLREPFAKRAGLINGR